jgi:hypothetical protein
MLGVAFSSRVWHARHRLYF